MNPLKLFVVCSSIMIWSQVSGAQVQEFSTANTATTIVTDITGTIARIWPTPDGNFYFTINETTEAAKCSHSSRWFRVRNGFNSVVAASIKNTLAIVTMAKLTGGRVAIRFDSSDSNCNVNYVYAF
jgi:hypothetical protein